MMKAISLIIIFLMVNVGTVLAHHHLYRVSPASSEVKRGMPKIAYSFNLEYAEKFTSFFDFDNKADYSYQDLSDAAVYLMQLGRIAEAKKILLELYQDYANEYNIVANLATALELSQEYDSAAIYVKNAILIKSLKQDDNNWVRLKILEAKKKISEDANWLLNNQVIDLKWDTMFYTSYPDSMYTKKQRDSLRQIRYERYGLEFDTLWQIGLQMSAQIPFSSSPNLLIANVMKELAYYFEVNVSIKDAFIAYKIAQYFDPNDQLKTKENLKKLMPFFNKYEFKESVFEEYFFPAAAFSEEDLKKLETYRATQESTSALFWEAKVAVGILLVLLIGFGLKRFNYLW